MQMILAVIEFGNLGVGLTKENGDLLIVLIGSTLGSFKASGLTPYKPSLAAKINNMGLGVFAGVVMAFHYLDDGHIWGAAITALITSSLSVALIDSLFRIVPDMVNKVVVKWLGLHLNLDLEESKKDEDNEE